MKTNRLPILFLVIIGVLLASPLSARILDELSFTIGNDWHTPNLGYNHDDGLTYGAHIQFYFNPAIELDISALAFTDKIETQSRYDILTLGAAYPFTFNVQGVELTIKPTLALLIGGNLELRAIQNTWHLIRKIPLLRVNYSTNTPTLHLQGGGEVTAHWPLGYGAVEVQGGGILAPTWIHRLHATVAYYPDYATRLALSYRFLDFTDTYPNQRDHFKNYDGLELSFTHQSGPLTEFFVFYPEAGVSYGAYLVNVFSFKEPKTFQHADWTYSFGLGFNQIIGSIQLYGITYRNISFEIRNASGSIKESGNEIGRHQGGLYALGYNVYFPINDFVQPFIKPYGGVERFAYLIDQKPIFEKFLPTLGVEVGVQVGKPLIFGATAWRTAIGLTVHYPFGYEKIASAIPAEYARAQSALQFGLLLKVEIDHDRKALARQGKRPKRGLSPYLP
ncbi:MAG: hypothetical protein WC954_06250 [Sphaerochaeta sp.]